jgi:hypothetical protein
MNLIYLPVLILLVIGLSYILLEFFGVIKKPDFIHGSLSRDPVMVLLWLVMVIVFICGLLTGFVV